MSDRMNMSECRKRSRTILVCLAAAWALAALAGCSSGFARWKPTADTRDTQAPAQTMEETSVGKPERFTPAQEVGAHDAEAFENAVERIGRLEYGKAETEIRQLLVRFESVDDPRYVSRALFWLGYCCEKQGVIDQARSYYERASERYPQTRPGQLARERLALLPAE